MLQAPSNLVTPLHDAHHDCLAKMAKFVYLIPAQQWQTINHKIFETKNKMLLIVEVV